MLNQCQFIGNLGRDPEIRSFQSGGKVANLSLAVTQTWRDKTSGDRKEKTEWVRVSVFSEGLVRVCEQYLRKGSKLYVSGQMETRKFQDANGQDKYSTEIVLRGFNSTLTMLDNRAGHDGSQGGQSGGGGYGGGGGAPQGDLDGDEIPFAKEWRA